MISPKMKLLLIFSIHNCMNNYPVLVLVFTLLFNVKNKSFSCFIYTTPELTTAKSSTFSLKRHLINLPLLDNPPHFNNIKANISYCLYRPFTFTKKKKKVNHFVHKTRAHEFVMNHFSLFHFLLIYPLTKSASREKAGGRTEGK